MNRIPRFMKEYANYQSNDISEQKLMKEENKGDAYEKI